MKTLLVTGSEGFIGRNLCLALRRQANFEVLGYDVQQSRDELPKLVARADLVFHLAGVDRPKEEREFEDVNLGLTRHLCGLLAASGRRTPLLLSSSIQAEADTPFGRSKRLAEDAVWDYHRQSAAPVYIYRLPNVFGKWSRPNYNTVVATFCHNISRGLPVHVSNRANRLRFIYIDDVVRACVEIAARPHHDPHTVRYQLQPEYIITVGELHDLIVSFKENRRKFLVPDFSNPLVKYLYSTYISFEDPKDQACPAELKTDEQGWLFELIRSSVAGQVFVCRTKPGMTRGDHYHDSKVEKCCVIQGQGILRFRSVLNQDVIEYPVDDQAIQVVDVPPGYTHSIENTGPTDMTLLFWVSEIFDPQHPDTHPLPVRP